MDFTKKVNDFGLFGNVLVVNNDIVESVSATKTTEKEAVLIIAAHVTNEAIRNQMKDGKLSPFEGLLQILLISLQISRTLSFLLKQ
jgi:hypothetical protein